jgi:flagellar protein FliO/FliZ
MSSLNDVVRYGAAARALASRALAFVTYVTCVTFVTFSTAFSAEKPFAAPEIAENVPVSSAGSLAQVTLSLLLVLAAVFAAAWLVRRLRGFGRPGNGAIEVIADLPLSAKERAVLVRVGNQQLLLGVAPGRVSTLYVLTEPVTVNEPQRMNDGSVPGIQNRPDFKAILKRSLGI